jgi:hypothetical protein
VPGGFRGQPRRTSASARDRLQEVQGLQS